MARAGLGGIHPTWGKAREGVRLVQTLTPPLGLASSPGNPLAAVGKQAQGCQVLPATAVAPSAAAASPSAPLCCRDRVPQGLQSLVPPRPIGDGDDLEQAVWRGSRSSEQDRTRQALKLAMPGHDPPAPNSSFFSRTNFVPCSIEKAQQLGHSLLPSSVGRYFGEDLWGLLFRAFFGGVRRFFLSLGFFKSYFFFFLKSYTLSCGKTLQNIPRRPTPNRSSGSFLFLRLPQVPSLPQSVPHPASASCQRPLRHALPNPPMPGQPLLGGVKGPMARDTAKTTAANRGQEQTSPSRWETVLRKRRCFAAACGEGCGSTMTLAAAARARGGHGDRPGSSLNARKLLLTPLGVAFSCLPGHCLVPSTGRPCWAPSPQG